MAPYTGYKSAKRARYYKKSASYKRPSLPMAKVSPRMGPGNQLWATLIYAGGFTLDNAASTTAVQQFSLNNLEDVDITGGDAEPTGWDQLKAIYSRFTVVKTEYKVMAINVSSGSQVVAVGVSDSTTSPTDVRQVIENGSAQWTLMNGVLNVDSDRRQWSDAVALDKLFGVTFSNLLAEDSYSHTASSTPDDQGVLNIAMTDLSGANNGAVQFYIEIRYNCLCRGASLTAGSV